MTRLPREGIMNDLLSDEKVNEYTGKAMVGALTRDEQFALARHAQELAFLNDALLTLLRERMT